MIEKYNRLYIFYGLSLLIPWALWFAVAYLSYIPEQSLPLQVAEQFLGMAGLVAPAMVAFYLVGKDKKMRNDLRNRFFQLPQSGIPYVWITIFLIPVSIVIAQLLSLFLGHGLDQFHITGNPTFTSALFSPWFILIFAPIAEELAWHSYGTDALRRKMNLLYASILFAVYWVLWHIPLSFIKGYYHAGVVAEGVIYSLNFIFSLFVFVVLMNWLYYKTKRNVTVSIVFHLTANLSNEIFSTHPDSKVIQTGILLLVSLVVLVKDRELFFRKDYVE